MSVASATIRDPRCLTEVTMFRFPPLRTTIRRPSLVMAMMLFSLPVLADTADPNVPGEASALAEPADAASLDAVDPVDPPKHDVTSRNNPYRAIVARNAFRLREPAPPPPPPTNVPAAPEPLKLDVKLAGVSEIGGVRYAYLVIPDTDRPGQFQYPTLTDNPDKGRVRHGSGLEVREIDVRKRFVRVINGGVEATLTFKDNGLKKDAAPVAGKPGAVPVLPPGNAGNVNRGATTAVFPAGGGGAAAAHPVAQPGSGGGEPLVFSRNANRASGNAGNMVVPPTAIGAGSGFQGGATTGNGGGNVPARPQRLDTTSVPSIPVEHQYDVLIRQREAAASVGIRLPPIPGMPSGPEMPVQ